MKLDGPVFAVPTPFKAGDLSVDAEALRECVRFLSDKGAQNIVSCGTTGEFSSLTKEERKEITAVCAKDFPGKVICHISSCCISESVELAKHAKEVGCAGVLLLPAYYFAGMGEDGVESFLAAVLKDCELPCFLYNFPKHTGNTITANMYGRLGKAFPGVVVGIKDSSGDLDGCKALKAAFPAGQVYVGNDGAAMTVLKDGLDGSVTGACNCLPEVLVGLDAAMKKDKATGGGHEEASECLDRLMRWHKAFSSAAMPEIPAVKSSIAHRLASAGFTGYSTVCRPPFTTPSPESTAQLSEWLGKGLL
mmetsp:Transcript_57219/g.134693  ORF Transcript_57219/g.134693 Transcript_57219/m.134693 type:complete len:306 (-) Transcript_57219:25-942(-)